MLFLLFTIFLSKGECNSDFNRLKERLIADGFDKKIIEKFYSHPKAKFLPQVIKIYSTYRESKLNYKHFLNKCFIFMGQKYLKQYQNTFSKVYKQYGVDPNIIVALLIIETKLGTYNGKYTVFNVLSSLAISEKFKKRAKWAYKELKAFLRYVIKYNLDPFSIKGSFAGAFGIPQFMPSSLWKFGQDGDDDGIIDLYNHHDAIMSVANYLKASGWKEDLSEEEKKKVLLHYNWSIYYVNTVLELSKKLKNSQYLSSSQTKGHIKF